MSAFPDFAYGRTTPACRGEDTNLFFPRKGETGDAAKAICARCPLRDACREWALSRPADRLYGIWGGMTDNDRVAWRVANSPVRQARPRRFVPPGTGIGEHHDTIAVMLARGQTWAEIATTIGFSREGVRKYWQKQLAEAVAAR